jgi:N-formylglutamate amidohydrolase
MGDHNRLNSQGKAMSDEDLKAELERLRNLFNERLMFQRHSISELLESFSFLYGSGLFQMTN